MALQITLSLLKLRPGGGFSRVYALIYIFRELRRDRTGKCREGAKLAKVIASKSDFQRIHSNGLALSFKPFTRNAGQSAVIFTLRQSSPPSLHSL